MTNNTMQQSALSSAMPWMVAALILIVLPFILRWLNYHHEQIGITIVLAMSYNMLLPGRYVSFGHAVYMGIGGFVAVHVMNIVENEYLWLYYRFFH